MRTVDSRARKSGPALLATLATLAALTTACHLGHHVGPLPGARERVAAEFARSGWSVRVSARVSGEHVERVQVLGPSSVDVWHVAPRLLVDRGAGPATTFVATAGTSLAEGVMLQDRGQAVELYDRTAVETCFAPDGHRAMVRVRPTASVGESGYARAWLGLYLLNDAMAVVEPGTEAPDCEAALASMPAPEAWIRRALEDVSGAGSSGRPSSALSRTPNNLLRGREPGTEPGSLPAWGDAWPFVFAVRGGVALDAVVDYALASGGVYRRREILRDELAAFERALGEGGAEGNPLALRLERDLTPGEAFSVGSTRVGQEFDPAEVSLAREMFSHAPTAFRAAAADRIVARWAAAGAVDFGELGRYRAGVAVIADQGDAARCDRLLDAVPREVNPAGYSTETFAAAAFRWLPACATPAAVLRAARAALAPEPSPDLDPGQVYTAVGFHECDIDAPAELGRTCESAPLRAAQLLAGRCDGETVGAARRAAAGPFNTARMAGERVLAGCRGAAR